ncbi:unnamed protein product, partial [Heterotrigona itama]
RRHDKSCLVFNCISYFAVSTMKSKFTSNETTTVTLIE